MRSRLIALSWFLCGAVSGLVADVGIARRHSTIVERRIMRLVVLRSELQHMVDQCGHDRVSDCRILGTLADQELCSRDHGHDGPCVFGSSDLMQREPT